MLHPDEVLMRFARGTHSGCKSVQKQAVCRIPTRSHIAVEHTSSQGVCLKKTLAKITIAAVSRGRCCHYTLTGRPRAHGSSGVPRDWVDRRLIASNMGPTWAAR